MITEQSVAFFCNSDPIAASPTSVIPQSAKKTKAGQRKRAPQKKSSEMGRKQSERNTAYLPYISSDVKLQLRCREVARAIAPASPMSFPVAAQKEQQGMHMYDTQACRELAASRKHTRAHRAPILH